MTRDSHVAGLQTLNLVPLSRLSPLNASNEPTQFGNTVQCPYILERVRSRYCNPMPSLCPSLPAFPEHAAVLLPV